MATQVTGGAGFIGSHLVDQPVKLERRVPVFDSLSAGEASHIFRWKQNETFDFIKGDLTKPSDCARTTG